MCRHLIEYFDSHRAMLIEDKPAFSPTTLRGWLSMFTAFWTHTGKGDLKAQLPIIECNIAKWEKTHTLKQSYVLTNEQLKTLFVDFADTKEFLLYKMYATVALSFAARGCEMV